VKWVKRRDQKVEKPLPIPKTTESIDIDNLSPWSKGDLKELRYSNLAPAGSLRKSRALASEPQSVFLHQNYIACIPVEVIIFIFFSKLIANLTYSKGFMHPQNLGYQKVCFSLSRKIKG
jgi:hypothetical protein